MDRAREFYGRVPALRPGGVERELKGQPGRYWVECEVGNVTLARSNAGARSGQGGPLVAFEVEDLAAAVAGIRDFGGLIVAEDIESPVGHFALIADPDGSGISLHQRTADGRH